MRRDNGGRSILIDGVDTGDGEEGAEGASNASGRSGEGREVDFGIGTSSRMV